MQGAALISSLLTSCGPLFFGFPPQAHLQRVGPEACAYVRAMVFANKAVATRGNMEREVQNWIQEMGKAPPGNDQGELPAEGL